MIHVRKIIWFVQRELIKQNKQKIVTNQIQFSKFN